jgi:hypothetical protein
LELLGGEQDREVDDDRAVQREIGDGLAISPGDGTVNSLDLRGRDFTQRRPDGNNVIRGVVGIGLVANEPQRPRLGNVTVTYF